MALAGMATAIDADADDPVVEARLVELAKDLRCLVCQNESLAGSQAALAQDLRREIRTQIRAGKSDGEVIDYLTVRYGDFVLYRPPFKPLTWLLWLGPLLFLGIGAAIWYRLVAGLPVAAEVQPPPDRLTDAARLLEDQTP
ncbi:MAG: cytochrome c-type biogenesis protein [Pseudomonadota bacterium]